MTTFNSIIQLGAKYKDSRTEITGYATAIFFNENGCVEVVLENVKDGETKTHFFSAQRLLRSPTTESQPMQTYETDIEFGREYEDTQTGIKGWPGVMEFHEGMANRVSIRSAGFDRDGNSKIIYHSIDDFLLKPVGGGETARRKDDKPSPVTREVERR